MNEYNEQAVETLDEAGSIIANKNSMIDGLTQKLAEAGEMIDYWIEHCESRHRDAETLKQQLTAAEARIKELEAELTKAFTRHRAIYEQGRAAAQAHNVRLWESSEKLVKAMSGTQAESDFAFQMFMLEEALRDQTGTDALEDYVMQRSCKTELYSSAGTARLLKEESK